MRKLALWFVFFVAAGVVGLAQAQEPGATFEMRVQVDSAFVRAAPTQDADMTASTYKDEILEAIGRNLDGTWFEVRRPGRLYNLGWIFNKMVDINFDAEYLPLTDMTTGIVGPSPLAEDPGLAVYIVEGVALRDRPLFNGTRITNLPADVTVPLLESNQNGTWLHVNYLGYDGWIIAFTIRERDDLPDILPVAANLPPLQTVDVVIIPPEIQLAQVQRMRAAIQPLYDTADYLAWLWGAVKRGEYMACEPPAEVVNTYNYASQDVRELPEIPRYAPRFDDGIAYLNDSIQALYGCGVKFPEVIDQAYADAINAKIIYATILESLDYLEEEVIH